MNDHVVGFRSHCSSFLTVKVSASEQFHFVTLIQRLTQQSEKRSDTCVNLEILLVKMHHKNARNKQFFALGDFRKYASMHAYIFNLVYNLIEDKSPNTYLIKPERTIRQASRTD